jgi:hypothetical protein
MAEERACNPFGSKLKEGRLESKRTAAAVKEATPKTVKASADCNPSKSRPNLERSCLRWSEFQKYPPEPRVECRQRQPSSWGRATQLRPAARGRRQLDSGQCGPRFSQAKMKINLYIWGSLTGNRVLSIGRIPSSCDASTYCAFL